VLVVRGKYCWLVAGGWFVLGEKYCWLVADKPNEQAASVPRSRCGVPSVHQSIAPTRPLESVGRLELASDAEVGASDGKRPTGARYSSVSETLTTHAHSSL
jgi:hypothetical protein